MVCGASLFQFWKLKAFMHEFQWMPKTDVQRQRMRDMQVPSLHLLFFSQPREGISSWELAHDYHASYCSDPRDRVFALLPLADLASRKMFQPDYTKSVVEIVLQLLRSKAKSDTEAAADAAARKLYFANIKFNFRMSQNVIGSFGLGPEDADIVAMLKQRESALHQDLEVLATRDCRQSMSRHNSNRLNQHLDESEKDLIMLDVLSHCTISTDHAGGYLAPLSRSGKSWRANRHATECATSLRAFDGTVVGLVSTEVKHGDTLLLFEWSSGHDSFHAGLIVRRFLVRRGSSVVTKIIGQCLVDSGVEVCHDHSACECKGHDPWVHVRDDQDEAWEVRMSPEDLLLFIAQDLKLEHRQPGKFVAPMVIFSAHVDESSKRLRISVAREELFSYAVINDLRSRRATGGMEAPVRAGGNEMVRVMAKMELKTSWLP